MQRKDLIIGAIVLAVVAGIVFFIQRRRQEVTTLPNPTPIASIEETQEKIENRFNVDVPEDVEKANLQDTSAEGFSGIATRDVKTGVSNITVLADLPDPETGKFYQAWARKVGQDKLLGRLRVAKGGYLLDTDVREDLSSFNGVVISLESKDDSKIETIVLQGTFPQK